MVDRLLLCTDLDRTLLPNGPQPEAPGARDRLARLVAHPGVTLAYVSGRHKALVEEAMTTWALPRPDYVIGDVGTTLWRVDDDWSRDKGWEAAIGNDWGGRGWKELAGLLKDVPALTRQPDDRQNRHKLSYFLDRDADVGSLGRAVQERLEPAQIRARTVFSVDETTGQGLLDVLPERASKRHAIEALMTVLEHDDTSTVFCGDSGNDLEVLVSPIPAVLVGNATDVVREAASAGALAAGTEGQLYCASGGFLGMNGHYAAGMLEGIAHYHPWTVPLMTGEAGAT